MDIRYNFMDSFNIVDKILEQTLKIGYNAIMSKQKGA